MIKITNIRTPVGDKAQKLFQIKIASRIRKMLKKSRIKANISIEY